MNILRFGSELAKRSSPAGIILGGAALVLAVPPVRQGLRAVTVAVVRGILSISAEAKKVTTASRESLEGIISEAKNSDTSYASDLDFTEGVAKLKTGSHHFAVAATMGVLTVSDKAKSLYQDASKQFKTIVQEAKKTKEPSNSPEIDTHEIESVHHNPGDEDLEAPKH
jgi:hypothetical protein